MINSKIKVIVVGASGKMGSLVCKKLNGTNEFEIVKVDKGDELDSKIGDMIIDFGSADSSIKSAEYANSKKIPLIIGSTGQSQKQKDLILSSAGNIPIIMCANFSLALASIKKIIKEIATNRVQNVTIIEKHHKQKLDSPSGTAIMLKNEISKYYSGKIEILSERGGKEVGTHQIDIFYENEMISIVHHAYSRETFADGVLLCAKFLKSAKAGLYDFENIVYFDEI